MSETAAADPGATVLRYYQAITVLMLAVIGLLIVYSIRLGPLVGPGVEQSFGFAVSGMFLAAALLLHIVDRTYRVWPEGRRVHPPVPDAVTDRAMSRALIVLVLLLVGGAIAYLLWTLLQ